jgi:hypothetical protein
MSDQDQDYIIVICPHCNDLVQIYKNEINCRIFRHGVYKATNESVNPHLDRESCEKLVESGTIYGCCKPFRLNDQNLPEICDYI